MQLTVVSEAAVREIIDLDLAFDAVGAALTSVANGEADIMPVVIAPAQDGALFGVKTATHLPAGLLGLKVGSYFPGNHQKGIPNHGSTTLLLDAETGLPSALVSAGYLNGFRTAAANAVAVDKLARPEAKTLGVIGAGHQAEFEIRAVTRRRPVEQVRVWSRNQAHAQAMCERLADLSCDLVAVATPQEAVQGADLITTVTPSTETLVEAAWVAPGTHISAMGSDTPGKRELDPQLMANPQAQAFADLPTQSVRVGEFQHAVAQNIIEQQAIVPMGKVLLGQHPGRTSNEHITVFDSSGVAPQDLHVAAAIVAQAKARGLAQTIEF